MKIDPAPRDIGRIIDDALVLFRANFRSTMAGTMAILFPVLLLAGVATSAYYASFFDFIAADLFMGSPGTGYAQPDEAVAVLFVFQILLYVSVPLRLVAVVWTSSSVFRSTPEWMAERPQTVRQFLAAGKARALQMGVVQIGLSIITQIISGVVAFAFGLVIVALSFVFAAGGVGGALIGFIVAVVAGLGALAVYLWLMGRFQLWGPAVVIEESGIGLSLTRSLALTKPHSWRTAWYWMAVGMVSYAFRLAIMAPATFVLGTNILPFIQDPGAATAALPLGITMLLGVSAAIAEVFVIPFERTCWAQYYLDLRSRVEGMDLLIRARDVAAGRV